MSELFFPPMVHERGNAIMSKALKDIDDLDLQAYVDSQISLSMDEQRRVLSAIEADPVLRRRYDDLLRQRSLLQAWWDENKRETLQ